MQSGVRGHWIGHSVESREKPCEYSEGVRDSQVETEDFALLQESGMPSEFCATWYGCRWNRKEESVVVRLWLVGGKCHSIDVTGNDRK